MAPLFRLPAPKALLAVVSISLALLAMPLMAGPSIDLSLEEIGMVPAAAAIRAPGDGSGRLFVPQVFGFVSIIQDGKVLPAPFLNIFSEIADPNNKGLNSMAFHPDYKNNGLFFVDYTHIDEDTEELRTIIARFSVSAEDPNMADHTSGVKILEVAQGDISLIGGDLHFGPDGYLYYGIGNGEDNLDNRSQDLSRLPGKILRIDVDTPPDPLLGGEACGIISNYVIPPDNPFVDSSGTCDAIWSYGLRQPFRLAFDRTTGDLFIGDLGEDTMEEIDFQPATSTGGENYGWACMEGTIPQNFGPCMPPGGPLVDPILTFLHATGDCLDGMGGGGAITGGYRYRGSAIPELVGSYLYANFCTGEIFRATEDNGVWTSSLALTAPVVFLSGFGEDENGELYVASVFGNVYRFTSTGIFSDSFESGDTSAWGSTVP